MCVLHVFMCECVCTCVWLCMYVLLHSFYMHPYIVNTCTCTLMSQVTSSEMMEDAVTLACKATSGPTHTQQPVFQWSTSGYPRPLGHPDKWDFIPVDVAWVL